uniref:G-protein coupled receptors family 1 profile domain-containing protein n=1 Tax=Sinocyclocheilus anshuiensis TaxID=1608454 RepID=A0A671S520_9TELE
MVLLVFFIITGFDHLQDQKLLGFLILITYMLILIGNGINLCIISTNRHLHKPMYILICNLAVVDIMFSSTCSTTMISVLLAKIKTISYYSCISRTYFYHLGDFTECMALTLMAIDRLIAIRLPLRYHSIVTNSRTFLFIFVTWLAGFAVIGFVISIADSVPYCQPFIRYVFCNYAAMIRAACVNPEPYFFITAIISLGPICGQFPFILCTYAVLAYSVTKLSNNSSRKQMISTCSSHLIVLLRVVLSLTDRNTVTIVASLVPSLINPTVYCTRTKEIRKRSTDVFLHKRIVPNHLSFISLYKCIGYIIIILYDKMIYYTSGGWWKIF